MWLKLYCDVLQDVTLEAMHSVIPLFGDTLRSVHAVGRASEIMERLYRFVVSGCTVPPSPCHRIPRCVRDPFFMTPSHAHAHTLSHVPGAAPLSSAA
jgi:hypothetical protein